MQDLSQTKPYTSFSTPGGDEHDTLTAIHTAQATMSALKPETMQDYSVQALRDVKQTGLVSDILLDVDPYKSYSLRAQDVSTKMIAASQEISDYMFDLPIYPNIQPSEVSLGSRKYPGPPTFSYALHMNE